MAGERERELPWESLPLVAQILDPKSLAVAASVSKSWHAVFSSDILWKPHLISHYPSSLFLPNSPAISINSLYSLLRTASNHRHRRPPPPRIALRQLFFAVDVFYGGNIVVSAGMPAGEIAADQGGIFRFGIDVEGWCEGFEEGGGEWRVLWVVAMEGWESAFGMMDRVERGRVVGGSGLWFSGELPESGCCGGGSGGSGGSGLMAEVGLEFCSGGGGKRKAGRLRLGLLNAYGCRYVELDDGLRYLQHFLLE